MSAFDWITERTGVLQVVDFMETLLDDASTSAEAWRPMCGPLYELLWKVGSYANARARASRCST